MGSRYDIADKECLGIISAVQTLALDFVSPRSDATTAIFEAETASKSGPVTAALSTLFGRLDEEITWVQNFYDGAVAGGTEAVVYYQTGDAQMAADAAAATYESPDVQDMPGRGRGGRASML